MFTDTETKVACLGEVPPLEFVLLDFEASFENFFGFGAADSNVDGNFLVTTDAKRSNGVAGFAYRKKRGQG